MKMNIDQKIALLKDKHNSELGKFSKNARDHVEKYGANRCDYLNHQIEMSNYHRGAWNALNEIQRDIEQ